MSRSELERFAKDISANAALLEEIRKQPAGGKRTVKFANSKGYHFTHEELESYVRERAKVRGKSLADSFLFLTKVKMSVKRS